MRQLFTIVCAASLLFGASVGTLEGDWLVLKDGSVVETAGTWQVKGNLVVFSMPNGSLASLRLSNVDLPSSTDLSLNGREEEMTPTAVKAPPRKIASFVITDANVSHDEYEAERDAAGANRGGTSPENPGSGLVITAWDRADAPENNGLIVTGTLENQGAAPLAGIVLSAVFYDENGDAILARDAQLNAQALSPQRRTNFRIDLPEIFDFSTVAFETATFSLATPRPDVEGEAADSDLEVF